MTRQKKYFNALLVGLTVLLACFDPGEKKEATPAEVKKAAHRNTKPPATYNKTVEISLPSAVFFGLDAVQEEKMKSVVTDTNVFKSIMHDCFYQKRNARMVLKKYYPRVKILEVKNARYLLFKKPEGSERIDLNEKSDPCGLFLFDGRQPPSLVDMMNIDSELGFYFKMTKE